ncbi:hypothetical protein H2199_002349 [Coniosporium tulheliwenetii]|uniref:Uncharacterized protein n=1 Tax=Coniosporium tulheliwenetii TaxID=3383036 RepID=A0ACC2ZII7_9PEZI|nr:hypothetical protein H2199_002349 [Cladosporium sp. JES 115]
MRLNIFAVAGLCSVGLAKASDDRNLRGGQDVLSVETETKRVAIIGAGAGGSSAAYHLRQYAAKAGSNVNITVYERNPYIGGRSTTVNVYDDPNEPVELGASIFVKINKILVDAAESFNLSTNSIRNARPRSENSDALDGSNSWWDIAKLLWKYGLAPIRTNNLMKRTVGKFLQMYEAPHFPWPSLSQVAFDLGLTAVTAATGKQYLKENNIDSRFAEEIVQASTRVNYAQNLPLIHGLETMVCMATDGAMSVEGGNWQIFSGMIGAASAGVRLNTSVVAVEKQRDGTYAVLSKLASAVEVSPTDNTAVEVFDSVIIAGPLQFSNIKIADIESADVESTSPLRHLPDAIPYVQLHVTLFTSKHPLYPPAFNQPLDKPLPNTILTTLQPHEHLGTNPDGVGAAGFFSISTLRKTSKGEFLYKIFSPRPVHDSFLHRITGYTPDESTLENTGSPAITWAYRKVWHSYPYEYPRVTFEELKLDENLWYTSGIESFISTMETSALMGKNIARGQWSCGKEDNTVA